MKYPYLSRKAAAAKQKRDLAVAKSPRRRKMKAENQRLRRAAKKKGQNIEGKDYDHNRKKFVSVKTNRSATKTTNNTMNKGKKKVIKNIKRQQSIGKKSKPLSAGAKKAGRKMLNKMAAKKKASPMKRKAKPVGKAKIQPVKKATAKKTATKTSVFKRKR